MVIERHYKELVSQHVRMLFWALKRGEPDRAHRAVDRYFELKELEDENAVSLDDHVDMIFEEQVANRLTEHGVNTLKDLLDYKQCDLLAIPRIGRTTVELIRAILNECGHDLKK